MPFLIKHLLIFDGDESKNNGDKKFYFILGQSAIHLFSASYRAIHSNLFLLVGEANTKQGQKKGFPLLSLAFSAFVFQFTFYKHCKKCSKI